MEDVFLGDLSHAKEITLKDWNKRSLWERFWEIVAQRFVQQY